MTNFLQHTRLHYSSTLKFGGRGIGVERPPNVRRGRGRGRWGYGGGSGADELEVVAGHRHLLRGTGAAARVEVVALHHVVFLRVGAHQIEQLAAATGGRGRCRARRREPEDLLVHELRCVHRDRDLAGAGWLVTEGEG